MGTKLLTITFLILFCSTGWGFAEAPINWDIQNVEFGNGSGQILFGDNYSWMWYGALNETAMEGKSVITVPQGANTYYACKGLVSGLPADDSNVTYEYKLRLPQGSFFKCYLSYIYFLY